MPIPKNKLTISLAAIFLVTLFSSFIALGYLLTQVKPSKKMVKNDRLLALDYLPDPGPIIPGLLKATQEEIEEAEREEKKSVFPSSEKILRKIREKLNQQASIRDVDKNASYVIIKVFDDSDKQKVEIKVRSTSDKNDTVLISSKEKKTAIDSNVEVLILKNDTLVIESTPTTCASDIEGDEVTTRRTYSDNETDSQV